MCNLTHRSILMPRRQAPELHQKIETENPRKKQLRAFNFFDVLEKTMDSESTTQTHTHWPFCTDLCSWSRSTRVKNDHETACSIHSACLPEWYESGFLSWKACPYNHNPLQAFNKKSQEFETKYRISTCRCMNCREVLWGAVNCREVLLGAAFSRT